MIFAYLSYNPNRMYQAAMSNYKSELEKQINQKHEDRKNFQIMSKIKGDLTIPFSEMYNDDFERMHRQINKYLSKDLVMKSYVNMNETNEDKFTKSKIIMNKYLIFHQKIIFILERTMPRNNVTNLIRHYRSNEVLAEPIRDHGPKIYRDSPKPLSRLNSRDIRLRNFKEKVSSRNHTINSASKPWFENVKTTLSRRGNNHLPVEQISNSFLKSITI